MVTKRCEIRGTKNIFSFLTSNFLSRTSTFVLLTSYLVLLSCSFKKETPPPPDLIDEKEMALVISDLTLSEAALNAEPLASFNDTLKRINVLREHHLNNERFLSSFKYYSENPKKLQGIYLDVLAILEKTDTLP